MYRFEPCVRVVCGAPERNWSRGSLWTLFRRSLANTARLAELWKYDYPNLAFESVPTGRLQSQFLPLDTELWKSTNYKAFQAERQRLLAAGMNAFSIV